MCSIKTQTDNSRKSTNAPPALPIGNASALWASRGVHNNNFVGQINYCFNVQENSIFLSQKVYDSFYLGVFHTKGAQQQTIIYHP